MKRFGEQMKKQLKEMGQIPKKEMGSIENAYACNWRINSLWAATQDDENRRIQGDRK